MERWLDRGMNMFSAIEEKRLPQMVKTKKVSVKREEKISTNSENQKDICDYAENRWYSLDNR